MGPKEALRWLALVAGSAGAICGGVLSCLDFLALLDQWRSYQTALRSVRAEHMAALKRGQCPQVNPAMPQDPGTRLFRVETSRGTYVVEAEHEAGARKAVEAEEREIEHHGPLCFLEAEGIRSVHLGREGGITLIHLADGERLRSLPALLPEILLLPLPPVAGFLIPWAALRVFARFPGESGPVREPSPGLLSVPTSGGGE
jgi:hypothetical protein